MRKYMFTVVVTWMDGKQEVYNCDEAVLEEGNLRLRYIDEVKYAWNFPFANIRVWRLEREDPELDAFQEKVGHGYDDRSKLGKYTIVRSSNE
jgi:hypothetical protein